MPKQKRATGRPALFIASREGLEAAFNRYVDTRLRLARAKAALDLRIAALNAAFDRDFDADAQSVGDLETAIELFCRSRRAELFPDGGRKSIAFANGTVGYRDNPVSVGKVVAKDTFERIAERMIDLDWTEPFLKFACSLKKDELIARRAELTDDQLAEAGIKFEKGETFYIEPASDLLDAAKKVATEADAA